MSAGPTREDAAAPDGTGGPLARLRARLPRRRGGRGGRTRGSRGSAELSVVVVAASLVAGLAFGEGLSRTVVDITDGLTWLSDDPSGEVIQVNPATGRPERRVAVGSPGDDLQVSQADGRLFVTNRTTGEVFSVDLASVLVSGQRRVATGDSSDLLLHDDAAYLVDRSTSSISRIDTSTTDAIGERWVAAEGLADATIDGAGRIWAIDTVGTLVELRWSATDRRFVTERTETIDYAGGSSVLVGHDEGVTVFGPDAGIVVQVGTGDDVVGDAPALSGELSAPDAAPSDLVPVSAPASGTVVIVGNGQFREVSVRAIGCGKPGRPAVHRGLVYVPCDGDGRIVVLGRDGRRAADDIRVPGDRDAELVVDDGNLIVNVPGAQAGLVVRSDGRVDDLTRYDDRVAPTRLAGAPTPRDVQQTADDDRAAGGPGPQVPPTTEAPETPEVPEAPTTGPSTPPTSGGPSLPPVTNATPPVGGPTGTPPTGAPTAPPGGTPGTPGAPGTGGPGTPGTPGDPDDDPPTEPSDPGTTPPAADQLQAPTGVVGAVVSEGVVEVSWAHAGPAAVSFDVAVVGSDVSYTSAAGTRRSARVSVPLGQSVQFVVTAVAADGSRATSAPSDPVVSNGRPGAPPNVTGSVATGAHDAGAVDATVTWEAAPTAGSPVTSYIVSITGGNPRRTITQTLGAGARTFTAQVDCADLGNEECDAGTTTASVSAENDQGVGLATTVTIGESGTSAPRLPSAGNQHVTGHTGGDLTKWEGSGEVTLALQPGDWASFPGACSYTVDGTAYDLACGQTSLTIQYNDGVQRQPCTTGARGGASTVERTRSIVFTANNGRTTVQSQSYTWTTTQPGACQDELIP